MPAPPESIAPSLAALRRRLDARAAGAWRVEGEHLGQLAFDAADDMPREVAATFAAATLVVPLDRLDLGIVAAVADGRRRVSIAGELPAGVGSGFWLRAFGAVRSVAVPLRDENGMIVGVISIALTSDLPDDDEVEAILVREAASWMRLEA